MNKNVIAITDANLLYYFTNYTLEDAYLVLNETELHLFVDSRYFEAVKGDKKIKTYLLETQNTFYAFLKSLNVTKLGLVYNYTSASLYDSLQSLGYKLFDASEFVFTKTAVKTDSEIALIKKAYEIAESSLIKALPLLKEGITETQFKTELEYICKKSGAEDMAFETIVAFGKGSSIPHYKTGDVRLENNMPILFDFGCKYKGYLSDISRSYYFGSPPKKYLDAYNSVKTAQTLAISNIKAGMTCKEADGIARNYLKEFNLDKFFIHSLGHGVGVKIHEEPRLSPKSEQILQENNVFSVEPGVYFEGEFGIRIEDTCIIKNGVCQSLSVNKIEKFILN